MADDLKQTGKPDDSRINVDQERSMKLVAIDRAMTSAEEFVSRQDAEGTFESLGARVDALRFKLYIVNHILREIIEATSGRAIDEERD